jgi:hypothetical protein
MSKSKYLSETIFRAYGSAQRVKIFKITRRIVPGMFPFFEVVKKEFHCTAQRDLAEATVAKLNGFHEPALKYKRSLEDWLEDALPD